MGHCYRQRLMNFFARGQEMKTLLSLVFGSALLVSPSLAQTDKDISLSEFRQSMYDSIVMLVDTPQGTSFAAQFQNIPDETLAKWYKGVPNGRRFQQVVSALKARTAGGVSLVRPRPYAGQSMALNPRRATAMSDAQSPMASPFASGITSVSAPDFSLFPPAYPSGPDWGNLVTLLQGASALPSGPASNFAAQRCIQDWKVFYSVLHSTFQGVKDAADSACEIVPDILVVILGEGATVPTKEICFAICLILNVLNSATDLVNGSCDEQDGLIQGTEIEAAYHNTVALYNLKLQLKIEQNLQNTASPMGLFELPTGLGGYLETARAIVAQTIANLTAVGQNANATAATAALNLGDTYFNSKSYKLAYKQYQTAYGLAVK